MQIQYQLWCHYDEPDVWRMEGFFQTHKEAMGKLDEIHNGPNSKMVEDWVVVMVQTY